MEVPRPIVIVDAMFECASYENSTDEEEDDNMRQCIGIVKHSDLNIKRRFVMDHLLDLERPWMP